jgi:hypothetical protein
MDRGFHGMVKIIVGFYLMSSLGLASTQAKLNGQNVEEARELLNNAGFDQTSVKVILYVANCVDKGITKTSKVIAKIVDKYFCQPGQINHATSIERIANNFNVNKTYKYVNMALCKCFDLTRENVRLTCYTPAFKRQNDAERNRAICNARTACELMREIIKRWNLHWEVI